MRDAVGSSWVFALVMTFTLLFSGFLVLIMVYSKTYKFKNEIITIIEKYEGLTVSNNDSNAASNWGSIYIINHYLYNNGYTAKGHCSEGDYAAEDLDDTLIKVSSGDVSKKYYYCVNYTKTPNDNYIFSVKLFFNFNLPIFGNLHQFSITGKTYEMSYGYIGNYEI